MRHLKDWIGDFFEDESLNFGRGGEELEGNGCTADFNRGIDRKCFFLALERFLGSGRKEDAFDVYFCFCECYHLFGAGYGDNVRTLIEVLSSYEEHSGVLLEKHRDHYAHAAYVFALGIVLWQNLPAVRQAFSEHGRGSGSKDGFLRQWGTAALFHDIGYPFEMAFEMIRDHVKNLGLPGAPCLRYGRLEAFAALDPDETAAMDSGETGSPFPEGEGAADKRILQYVCTRLGLSFEELLPGFRARIEGEPKFMDHAYFSAVLLLKRLIPHAGPSVDERLETAGAVFLHNSYFRFELVKGRGVGPLSIRQYPLAFLLMLCDDLQTWDRTPYGRKSKEKPIAWDVELDLSEGGISVLYHFEPDGAERAMECKRKDAEDLAERLALGEVFSRYELDADFLIKRKVPALHMSNNHFKKLVEIAFAVNARYAAEGQRSQAYLEQSWDELTLEYKLSNLSQAKSYAQKLELIGCFYDDKLLSYPVKERFSEAELEVISRAEHDRWWTEKLEMGWKRGEPVGETKAERRADRERRRVNPDLIPYDELSREEQDKDRILMGEMIEFLKSRADIKVYSMQGEPEVPYLIAFAGHRKLEEARIPRYRKELERIFGERLEEHGRVKLLCEFADGADLIAAEAAYALKIPVIAVLPKPPEEYCGEIRSPDFDRLLERAESVFAVPALTPQAYYNAGKVLTDNADELVALWNGETPPLEDGEGNPVNLGGTWHNILLARRRGIPETIIRL